MGDYIVSCAHCCSGVWPESDLEDKEGKIIICPICLWKNYIEFSDVLYITDHYDSERAKKINKLTRMEIGEQRYFDLESEGWDDGDGRSDLNYIYLEPCPVCFKEDEDAEITYEGWVDFEFDLLKENTEITCKCGAKFKLIHHAQYPAKEAYSILENRWERIA